MIRAPAWAYGLTAAAVALFSALGIWQLRRGLGKEALAAQFEHGAGDPDLVSHRFGAPPEGTLRFAQATGRYLADLQLLQDGQSHRHQPGYHVWTPLQLADESVVLVNRGWIPADRSGLEGAVPAGTVTVTGFWRALPRPGVRLAGTENCRPGTAFPAVVVYPTPDEVECLLKRPFTGLLLLDPEAPGGYVREWKDVGFPPVRHYAYAVQWFALAIAAIVVFVVVNRKRPA